MSQSSADSAARRHQLCDVLLAYLQDSEVHLWPGGDGLTAEEAVRDYARAAAAGLVPDQQELAARHPELAAEAAAFFAEQEALLPLG